MISLNWRQVKKGMGELNICKSNQLTDYGSSSLIQSQQDPVMIRCHDYQKWFLLRENREVYW